MLSWGAAPGWYSDAPSALLLLLKMGIASNADVTGPKAQSISAWGNAPGKKGTTEHKGLKARPIINSCRGGFGDC